MSKPSEIEVRKAIRLIQNRTPQLTMKEFAIAREKMQDKIVSNLVHSAFTDALLYAIGEDSPMFIQFIDQVQREAKDEVQDN